MYIAGVDVGSTQSKGLIMDDERRILGRSLLDTGANVVKAAERAFALALEDARLDPGDIAYIVGTGYGRYKVTFESRREPRFPRRGVSFVEYCRHEDWGEG